MKLFFFVAIALALVAQAKVDRAEAWIEELPAKGKAVMEKWTAKCQSGKSVHDMSHCEMDTCKVSSRKKR